MADPQEPGSTDSPARRTPGGPAGGGGRFGPDWRHLHLWQIQPVRDLLIVAAVFGLVYVGYQAKLVTVPLLVALLLAYLFEPLVLLLTRRGLLSRRGVVLGIIAGVLITVVAPITVGMSYAVVQGVGFAGRLSGQIRMVFASVDDHENPALREKIRGEAWRDIRDWLVERKHVKPPETIPVDEEFVGPPLPPLVPDEVASAKMLKSVMSWIEQNAAGIASTLGKAAVGSGTQALVVVLGTFASLGAMLFGLFLTMFFFYFLSTGWGRVLARAQSFIPHAGKYRWTRVLRRMDRAIAGFVRGRLTICAILAVYMTVAFTIIGAPAPLLLGPLVGAMFIVPFAPALVVPVVMLLLWLQSDAGGGFRSEWWWILAAPIAVHIGGQILDDYILTPKIQGDNTDLEMPTILFASLAGGALAGVYGLLLAIPAAACLKILANEFLWPRVAAWVRGQVHDPLPIGRE